jgi:hypothetical protein
VYYYYLSYLPYTTRVRVDGAPVWLLELREKLEKRAERESST